MEEGQEKVDAEEAMVDDENEEEKETTEPDTDEQEADAEDGEDEDNIKVEKEGWREEEEEEAEEKDEEGDEEEDEGEEEKKEGEKEEEGGGEEELPSEEVEEAGFPRRWKMSAQWTRQVRHETVSQGWWQVRRIRREAKWTRKGNDRRGEHSAGFNPSRNISARTQTKQPQSPGSCINEVSITSYELKHGTSCFSAT